MNLTTRQTALPARRSPQTAASTGTPLQARMFRRLTDVIALSSQ
jgi:hypothetical protein